MTECVFILHYPQVDRVECLYYCQVGTISQNSAQAVSVFVKISFFKLLFLFHAATYDNFVLINPLIIFY